MDSWEDAWKFVVIKRSFLFPKMLGEEVSCLLKLLEDVQAWFAKKA